MHHGTSRSGTRSAVPGAAGSAAAASAAAATGPHIEMYERVRKEGNSGSELAPSSPLLPDAEKSDELGYGHNGHGNAEEEEHLAGHWRTFINTTMAFIGAGILGLPSSFKTGGLWLSLGTLAVAGVGSMYCMWLLVLCRRLLASQGATSYSDVCRIALGTPGMVVVEFSLIVTQASFSIAYILFIARNFEQITGIAQPLVVAMCMPLLFALCLFRHAKYLAPFAMFAEAVNLVGMAVVLTTDVKTMNVNHPDVVQANWPALPFITGVFLYCFEGMGMVLSLEANALHKQSFVPILTAVVTLYAVLCAAMGAMGYLAYGAATRDIVLLNMGNTPFTLVVKVSFCIGLYFTYPLMMVPIWEVLEPKCLHKPSSRGGRGLLRLTGVCLTGLIAAWVPSFSLFMGLIGSSCCSLLAFILPPLAYGQIVHAAGSRLEPWRRLLHAVIMGAGVLAGVTGTIDAVRQLVKA